MTAALLVTDRTSVREPVGSLLEREGYEVFLCPGPQPPAYTCAGGRGERCVLAEASEVVVLDCDLASDVALQGTPSWHLLWYYRRLGKPVVALASSSELPGAVGDDEVVVLPHPIDPHSVVAAIRGLLDPRATA